QGTLFAEASLANNALVPGRNRVRRLMTPHARSTRPNLSAREGALRSSGSRSTSIYDSASTAHLNWLQAPAMGGVHASLHHVAIAVVIVGIVVRIVVIVVVRVVAAEAESKAAPEVAVVPEAAIMVEAATRLAA